MAAVTATSKQPLSLPFEQAFDWADHLYKDHIQKIIDLTPMIGTEEKKLGVVSDRVRKTILTKDEGKTENNTSLQFYFSALKTKFLAEHILNSTKATREYCTYPAWTESDFTRYKGENKDPQLLINENSRAAERIKILSSNVDELETQIHAIDKALEVLRNTLDQSIMRETTGNGLINRGLRSVWSTVYDYSYLNARIDEHNKTAEAAFDPKKAREEIAKFTNCLRSKRIFNCRSFRSASTLYCLDRHSRSKQCGS